MRRLCALRRDSGGVVRHCLNHPEVGTYGGGSEAANALAVSAIAAAFFDATGKPARRLPLKPTYVQSLLKA
jgi:nicotinate dehydrogenase subunit B